MNILFWVPYPTQGPSNRFRVEQYLPYLKQRGVSYSVSSFWSDNGYEVLYGNGRYLKKFFSFTGGMASRVKDIAGLRRFDAVFIHREACPLGTAVLERIVRLKKPVIFDFDDSIFLPSFTSSNKIMRIFKRPDKTKKILALSSQVIAGNKYLADYALQFNKNVRVIPTCIDTDKYNYPVPKAEKKKIVIGWIGTYSTNQYLKLLAEVFSELLKEFPDSIEIKLVGCKQDFFTIPGISYKRWSLDTEIDDLRSFDIGLMPIWDDAWTRGKCSFKIIQYMSMGIPVVASAVGMNNEVVVDGKNGFLVNNNKEWNNRLVQLITDPGLRMRMGREGRKTVEEKFSLKVNAPVFYETISGCVKK
ncbi:MAG: glycosyltransferase family 4 protein [Candidatus Omnitrophica bacterium]|nr:glycosyltransferase family 4 protein [Candidatus Omnitrophota bacterium]